MSQAPGDQLEKHGFLVLAAAQVANISGLLFHMLMGGSWVSWSLSQEDYQCLVFMLNTILIALIPMDAIRTMVSHYAALMAREGHCGDCLLYTSDAADE